MMKMPHWPIPLGSKDIDLDLSRIRTLLKELDNPQEKLPAIIHIAGTNGKGSTLAFLKAIFIAAGYRVHSYTSPHLVNFNERINILGAAIEDNFLTEMTEECRLAAERINIRPTFFEGTTAIALLAFARVKADIVLLEVGMGGRLDATNVITNPAMSIITNISLDHTDFLGSNILQIAFEKAGIIKANCACVLAQQYLEVTELIEKIAEQNNAELFVFEDDWLIEPGLYQCQERQIKLPKLSLLGDHQYMNAGNAITAAINLKEFNISDAHISMGLTRAIWPARLQKLKEGSIVNKLPKDWQIWVDGAHNEAAAHVISVWLQDEPKMPTYMIFGMTKGRDVLVFLKPFVPQIEHLVGLLIESEPSSYGAEFIMKQAQLLGISAGACDSIDEAISTIISIGKSPARILVCGSLYLASEVLGAN